MHKHVLLFVAPLIFLVSATGIYLAPSHKEIALMQMNDADFKEAMTTFTSLYAQGDNSINVVAPLVKLYIQAGDVDRAISLLEGYVAKNPGSVEGRKHLADLYLSSQRFYNYCRVLEDIQTRTPSTVILRKLADTYDFLGQPEKEMEALAKLVRRNDYVPLEDDYVKLASFYKITAHSDRAIATILDIIDINHFKVTADTIHLAVQLLLEDGQEEKALTSAKAYFRKNGEEGDAIMISSLFQLYGKIDSAYIVLEPFLLNADYSSPLEQQLVGLLLIQKKEDDVFTMLSWQYKKNVLQEPLRMMLLDLAMSRRDYALVESLFHTMHLGKAPESDLLRYANWSLQVGRPDFAQIIENQLGTQYLQQKPLLAAIIKVIAQDIPENMLALMNVPEESVVLPEQKMILADLYLKHGYVKRAFSFVDGLSIGDLLGHFEAMQLAELYLDAAMVEKARRLLEQASASSQPPLQPSIDKTLLLLAVGEGKTDIVQQWLSNHSMERNNEALLTDSYDISMRYHHDKLSLDFAQQLYRLSPTQKNSLQLANAFLTNHLYTEAFTYLQVPDAHDVTSRGIYLDAMASWIHQAGANRVPETNRKSFESLITVILQDPHLASDEKRNLAYLLQEAGFKDKAEAIFWALADKQSFGSKDVTELLGLWGNNLSSNAVHWLEERAQMASNAEKASWLNYLNDTGHPEEVLVVLQGNDPNLPAAITDAYVNALISTHHTKELNDTLVRLVDTTSDTSQLEKWATIAEQEELPPEIATSAWRKLYQLDPSNARAERNFGLSAAYTNHADVARKHLHHYLAHNKSDYEVNAAYADILQQDGEKEQAQLYFSEALEQLSKLKEKNTSILIDEAHLLYRNNRLEESVSLYRSLLAEQPQNKTLRADFAEMLIETRQYDEASALLFH